MGKGALSYPMLGRLYNGQAFLGVEVCLFVYLQTKLENIKILLKCNVYLLSSSNSTIRIHPTNVPL